MAKTNQGDDLILTSTDERNRETERQEIAWLHTAPDKVFLYVSMPENVEPFASYSWSRGNHLASCCKLALAMHAIQCPVCRKSAGQMATDKARAVAITTWLGTSVATHVSIGKRVATGGIAGPHAYKRAVNCKLGGVDYYGWYYESAGQYCRLTKAKGTK